MAILVRNDLANRTMGIDQVTKEQLAAAVNRQTELILELRTQVQGMSQILIALALEPEAFTHVDGDVKVSNAAIESVQAGMQIRIQYTNDAVLLRAVAAAAAPLIVAPRLM